MKVTAEMRETAHSNGIYTQALHARLRIGWSVLDATTRPMLLQDRKVRSDKYLGDFAIYQGETNVFNGNLKECASFLDVTETTVNYYAAPSYKKMLADRNAKNAREVVRLDVDSESCY